MYLNRVVPTLEAQSGKKLDASAINQIEQYESYARLCEKTNDKSLPYWVAKRIRIFLGLQAMLLFTFVFLVL